jgi:hypothetical protein
MHPSIGKWVRASVLATAMIGSNLWADFVSYGCP